MTTEPTTTLPKWLNLDAIHPPEALAELPALIDAARKVLEAVAAFNREHIEQMDAYYSRNDYDAEGISEVVDAFTGMNTADNYLLLAGYLIECTVIGQGTVTEMYAKELVHEYAHLITGVRAIGGGTSLPVVRERVAAQPEGSSEEVEA